MSNCEICLLQERELGAALTLTQCICCGRWFCPKCAAGEFSDCCVRCGSNLGDGEAA